MKISFMLVIGILLFLSVPVSATIIHSPAQEETIPYGSQGYITITVANNINDLGENGLLYVYIRHEDSTTPIRFDIYQSFPALGNYGNGEYTIEYDRDLFPYNNITYSIYTSLEGNGHAYEGSYTHFYVGSEGNLTNYLYLYNADPWNYEFEGFRAVIDGMTFQAKSRQQIPVYFFVVNGSATTKYIDAVYGLRNCEYVPADAVDYLGETYYIGQQPQNFTVSKNNFDARKGYFVYFGVSSEYYGDIAFTCDESFNGTGYEISDALNFSTSGWDKQNIWTGEPNTLINGHSLENDFYGFFVYFETYGEDGISFGGGLPTSKPTNMFSLLIKDYCDKPVSEGGLGMPWVFYLFGFIIPIFLVGLVYRFARKWEISVPNFIYSAMVIGGCIASFSIGFQELWMTGFVSVVMVFTTAYTYREALNIGYSTVTGTEAGRRAGVRATTSIGTGIAKPLSMRAGIARDEGVSSRQMHQERIDLERELALQGMTTQRNLSRSERRFIQKQNKLQRDAYAYELAKQTIPPINRETKRMEKPLAHRVSYETTDWRTNVEIGKRATDQDVQTDLFGRIKRNGKTKRRKK